MISTHRLAARVLVLSASMILARAMPAAWDEAATSMTGPPRARRP